MGRSRASAKQAGSLFESQVARFLSKRLKDDRIERRAKNGSKDRGDIASVRTPAGQKVVLECKDVAKLALGTWIEEAEAERVNDNAPISAVVHKRRGRGESRMGESYVTMTLESLALLLGAEDERE